MTEKISINDIIIKNQKKIAKIIREINKAKIIYKNVSKKYIQGNILKFIFTYHISKKCIL